MSAEPLSPKTERVAAPVLDAALREEYRTLFASIVLRPGRARVADALVDKAVSLRPRYAELETALGVPWPYIAAIHGLEFSFGLTGHLHNGDPLTARTVNRPRGRPKTGTPPFTWRESAEDALVCQRLHLWRDWSLAGTLFKLEAYNGFGYRMFHPEVLSPYLWSFSTHYVKGKYAADGKWDPDLVSQQCGAAVLLHRMVKRGIVAFPADPTAPIPQALPELRSGTTGDAVRRAQGLLRAAYPELTDADLAIDGKFGRRTRDRVKQFQAERGLDADGDVRAATWAALLDLD